MKPLILVLLLCLIVFSQCDSNIPIIGTEKKSAIDKLLATLPRNCYFAQFGSRTTGYKIVDNNDGTISLVSYNTLGTDFCPPPFAKTESILSVQYYIKKCIQGQVYRQAQNDCKGTGTAADYWGAQKLQLCSVLGCSSGTPAEDSCLNDNLNSIKWEITTFYTSEMDYFNTLAGYFVKQNDIPNTKSDYYWIAAYAYNMLGDKYFGSRSEALYVSCFKRVNT